MLFTSARDTQAVQPLIDDANLQAAIQLSLGADPVSSVMIPRAANHGNEPLTELSESTIKTLA